MKSTHLVTSAVCTAFATVLVLACSAPIRGDVDLGTRDDAGVSTGFSPLPDAATEPSEQGLTNYCPSNKCPADRVTCPDSRFPCDVNLAVDSMNCGACGHACPQQTYGSTFICVDGTCQMECQVSPSKYLDCDGVVDNGCEVLPERNNDDCGGCGIKCGDPSKPCLQTPQGDWICGCLPPQVVCSSFYGPACSDLQVDDKNCNGCGTVCDAKDGGGKPPLPNAYFGCTGGECQHYKCNTDYADCNHDLNSVPSNGCESYLWDSKNCGGCGIACDAGQECQPDTFGNPMCACPAGETYCGSCYSTWPHGCSGACVDTTTDLYNCGGCGAGCGFNYDTVYAVCEYGSCDYRCLGGTADCNGNIEDYCEVKTDSDPYNCGACGNACNVDAGQACVHGRCVVEPCPVQEAGVPQ